MLVTGAGGFLGRHLVPELVAHGHDVDAPSSADVNLQRADALDALPAVTYDRVYHLAAWTRAGRLCQERMGEQWVVNQRINTNVLAWWQSSQPQAKLIAFGTSASYARSGVHHERDYMDGEPPEAYYAYAMTKRMLLVGLQSLGAQFDLDWLYIVPSTLYGPGYHTDGRELHFVYDIARKVVRGADLGEPVVLWGDGTERRELVHVSDAVRIIGRLAGAGSREVVNLASGSDVSISELAADICVAAGYPMAEVGFDVGARIGERDKLLATDRLRQILGEVPPMVPLRRGIAEVVTWVRAHLDELEPRP